MRTPLACSLLASATLCLAATWSRSPGADLSTMQKPEWDEDGHLLVPKGFERWVFVGSSLGLGYSERTSKGPGTFKNIYTQPEAVDYYAENGQFPDGTMLVMTVYTSTDERGTARAGWFAKDRLAVEVAVKDKTHIDQVWGYFDFGGPKKPKVRAKPFAKSRCYDCHEKSAAVDNVFVQFYPTLLEVRPRHDKKQ